MQKIFIKRADLAAQSKPPQPPKDDPVEVVVTDVRLPFWSVYRIVSQVLFSIFLIALIPLLIAGFIALLGWMLL